MSSGDRSRGTLGGLWSRLTGHDAGDRQYQAGLLRINALETELAGLDDPQLRECAEELRSASSSRLGAPDLERCFALVREAARRTLRMRHFDCQIVGGLALHEGRLLEMQTGEGKTLVATLPVVAAALGGERVHVHTFNDYLARRDAAWMGPLYHLLGISVAHVEAGHTAAERRRAYGAEIVYLTPGEAGFDHLRDGLRTDASQRVQPELGFALVDEADSILVDEARVPLVIAGERESAPHNASRMDAMARELQRNRDFEVDEGGGASYLTDSGARRAEAALAVESMYGEDAVGLLADLTAALYARELLDRDVDYIVRDGRIEMIDEFTGRVVRDRQWPDGVQAALEAKEGLRFRREGRMMATITLQHLFRLYRRLAGMTATARPDAEEMREFYGLELMVVPPNRPCIRTDLPDRVYTHAEPRRTAVRDRIIESHRDGRPVLVGTGSVLESELLAESLRADGLDPAVLNARTDEQEAAIIAEAGRPGALTISTNMAGRGTDIRLGGADERERQQVIEAGGLLVIATGLHESRRIDRQLRGRAGRQGDPGASEFFLSFDDAIFVEYGVERIIPARLREPRSEAVDDLSLEGRIDYAQAALESQNLDVRRALFGFSDFVEQQRLQLQSMRDEALEEAGGLDGWARADPGRHSRLVEAWGADHCAHLEQHVAVAALDRAWADHLEHLEELREGVQFLRLGTENPLHEFIRVADDGFRDLLRRCDAEVAEALWRCDPGSPPAHPHDLGVPRTAATWTYLVEHDPVRDAMQLHIAGNIGLSVGAAIWMPLFLAVAVYRRYFKKRHSSRDGSLSNSYPSPSQNPDL